MSEQETMNDNLINLTNSFFEKMKEVNPKGGLKDFVKMSYEAGYKEAQSQNEKLVKENEELREAMERIYNTSMTPTMTDEHGYKKMLHMGELAEQALKK